MKNISHKINVRQFLSDIDDNASDNESDNSSEDIDSSEHSEDKPIKKNKNSLPSTTLEVMYPSSNDGTRSVVIGPSGSGKTVCIRNIVLQLTNTHTITSIYWIGANHEYESWIKKDFRFTDMNYKLVDGLIEYQKSKLSKNGHIIIVLDDVADIEFHTGKKKKWWSSLLSNSRKWRIHLVFGLQYVKFISPSMRENITNWIVLKANNTSKNALSELSSCTNKWDFMKHFDKFNVGQAIVFDTNPRAESELHILKIENISAKDME